LFVRSSLIAIPFGAASAVWAACASQPLNEAAWTHVVVGIRYLYDREYELAEERCRLALEYGDHNPEAYNCLGIVALYARNNLDEAGENFKRAIQRNSDFAQAHNNLGVVLYRRTPPDLQGACEEYDAALKIDPGYLDARENLARTLLERGTVAAGLGRFLEKDELDKAARSQLIRLSEMAPSNARAHAYLGLIDFSAMHFERAAREFERCLEIDPEDKICHYDLGNARLALADCDRAIPSFVAALRHGRSEIAPDAVRNLGVAYEMCARKNGAIAVYLDRIKSDPRNPVAHFDLARIFTERGLHQEAATELASTLALDPGYCPAYFELAMQADRMLDTKATIDRCEQFVDCSIVRAAREVQRSPGETNEIDRCKDLIHRLALE
jgi:tetratricopeptide (TPR) repeat protein